MDVGETMQFRRNALTAPVPCGSPFHQGMPTAAKRFVSMKCPSCGIFWDVLLCETCHNRMNHNALRCKCGVVSKGLAWIAMDFPMSGPVVKKA